VVALPPETNEFGLTKELAGFWWIELTGRFNFLATICTTFVLMPFEEKQTKKHFSLEVIIHRLTCKNN
jgi:hypothetical protein